MRKQPMAWIGTVLVLAACGGGGASTSSPQPAPPVEAPRQEAAPPVQPKKLQLPEISDRTQPAQSRVFIAFERESIRVGGVPPEARTDAGIDLAKLPPGSVTTPEDLYGALRELHRAEVIKDPPPPPPPPKPAPAKKKSNKKLTPREQAIEQARAAGILGAEPTYPSCGSPMPMLHGAGGERPPEIPPDHAVACVPDVPDETARFASLIIADRDLPARIVVTPLISEYGVSLARFATTSDGTHARTLGVQVGQRSAPGSGHLRRPPAAFVLVLEPATDPITLARSFQGSGVWIWVKGDSTYGNLVTLLDALTASGVTMLTLTLDDPR